MQCVYLIIVLLRSRVLFTMVCIKNLYIHTIKGEFWLACINTALIADLRAYVTSDLDKWVWVLCSQCEKGKKINTPL